MSRIKPPSLRGPRSAVRPSRTDETGAAQARTKPALDRPGSGFDRKRPARAADGEGRLRLRLARPTTPAEAQALRERLGGRGASFRESLVNFQRENGLNPTGALSPATLRRLERLGVAREEGSRFPEALTSLLSLPKPGALLPAPLLAAADTPPVESRELADGVGRLIGRRLTPEPVIDPAILPFPVSSGVLLGTVAPDGATTSQAERARDALQFFLGD